MGNRTRLVRRRIILIVGVAAFLYRLHVRVELRYRRHLDRQILPCKAISAFDRSETAQSPAGEIAGVARRLLVVEADVAVALATAENVNRASNGILTTFRQSAASDSTFQTQAFSSTFFQIWHAFRTSEQHRHHLRFAFQGVFLKSVRKLTQPFGI